MRQISEQLQLSKPALYHHFRDKQALLLEVLLAGVEQAGSLVRQAAASGSDTRSRVSALLRGIAVNRQAQMNAMRLAERDAVHLSGPAREAMYAAYRTQFLQPVEELLRSGQVAGEVRADADPAWLTRALLVLAQPLLSVDEADSESVVAATVALFFEGAGG